jgi:hypothetical protein
MNLTTDTTNITNAAFALTASLSALSFTACRAIIEPPDHQDRLRYAGERLLHGAILMLVASVIKYAVFAWGVSQQLNPSGFMSVLLVLVGFISSYSCAQGFWFAHRAFVELNSVLWSRYERLPDAGRRPFYALTR